MTLDVERARASRAELARRGSASIEPALAEGIVRVANANMERAIRVVSVERGHDPRDFALLAFGGAGGMHACEIADTLDIATVLVPRHAGVLSALGMLLADVTKDYSATVLRPATTSTLRRARRRGSRRSSRGARAISAREGLRRRRDRASSGRSTSATSASRTRSPCRSAPAIARRVRSPPRADSTATRIRVAPTEVVDVRVRATGVTDKPALPRRGRCAARSRPTPARTIRAAFGGTRARRPRSIAGDDLAPGAAAAGPAVIAGARGDRRRAAGLPVPRRRLRQRRRVRRRAADDDVEPRWPRRGMSDAHRSHRVRDLQEPLPLDRRGDGRHAVPHRLLAEHQGAARLLVRGLRRARARRSRRAITCRCTSARCRCRCAPRSITSPMEPGDVVMLNDPFHGGTHLPDITLVSPVFLGRGRAAGVLRRQPRASLRRRRHEPGLDAARARDLPGRADPPAGQARAPRRDRRRRAGADPRQRAHARRARGRSDRADRRQSRRRDAAARDRRDVRPRRGRSATPPRCRTTPSACCARRSRRFPTAGTRSRTRSTTTASATGRSRSARRVRDRAATGATVDFTGTAPQTAGSVNANFAITLSATPLRVPLPGARGRALQRRHRAAADGHRAGGHDRQRAAAGGGGRRQRRDVAAHHRRRARRARRRRCRIASRPRARAR